MAAIQREPSGGYPAVVPVTLPDGTTAYLMGVASVDASGKAATPQETFPLAATNTATAAQTVYGGDYIFAQQASAYGTIALQVLGPDGTTYQTIVSKTASDTTGGTGVALGSGAVVRVVLTGTTAAFVTLSRVPA